MVRGYILGERRRQRQGQEWRAVLKARETYDKRTYV